MKKMMKMITLFVVLFSVVPKSRQQEEEFSYIVGSPTGPDRWGYLHPEWAQCKVGKLQSPIDLPKDCRAQVPGPLARTSYFYSPANATVKNRGHDIQVIWPDGTSKIRINNTDYILKQCHFHTPTEHTINGLRYAMELHMVHVNPDPNAVQKYAVVAFLYAFGAPDPFLSKLTSKIRQISDTDKEILAGVVDPTIPITGKTKKYFQYIGSLTTPPCSEPVLWTIDTKVGTVSHGQIKLLQKAVRDEAIRNARPLQPRNGRDIALYKVA